MVLERSPTENEPSSSAVYGPPYWLTADVPPMRPSLNSAVIATSMGFWLLKKHPVRIAYVSETMTARVAAWRRGS